MRAKLLQSSQTLCDPMYCSPQAPLSTGFSRREHWSGLPCSPPGDLPNWGWNPAPLMSPAWQAGSLSLVPPGKPQRKSENQSRSVVSDFLRPHGIPQATILEWVALPQRILLYAGAIPQVCTEVLKESQLRLSLPMEWINWLK